jgi:hypothetical protein
VKRYYTKGMMLNHAALEAALPGYVDRVRRIYTHQASPALVDEFAGWPPCHHAEHRLMPENVATW